MNAGLFSIGLDTYWAQFDGLLDNLNGYHAQIRDRIAALGPDVVDGGMVDNEFKARDAAKKGSVRNGTKLSRFSTVFAPVKRLFHFVSCSGQKLVG
ncbi:MAG: hypothetical protein ABFR47_08635, partial [Verrucomicrobiota bacterium]